jgi:predicted Rossmann fold flavoprotein
MKVAIIGAGAAGCFAAANIQRKSGIEVAVFEKTGKVMQKVRVSGGGRCNVTHECFDVPELLTRYPRGKSLLRKSLYRFGPQQTIDWFGQRGVTLKTEDDGRMFPVTDDSATIIDCIWQEMMRQNVQVYYHKSVKSISVNEQSPRFTIHFADTSIHTADKILLATGSFPRADQYSWLESLGLSIESPVPSLFTFNMPRHPITELMGVSVPEVSIKIAGTKISQSGPLLITHWGMSGPAVLKTSAIAARELANMHYDFKALINWLHNMSDDDLRITFAQLRREQGKQFVAQKNPFALPKRLWEYFMKCCSISDSMRWGDLPAAAQHKLMEQLLHDAYHVSGKTTFKEEFVTCGGVRIQEIDPQTMQSRKIPGIYLAGELIDADGITGGYNFQHAWSSAWIAASAITATETLPA